MRRTELVKRLRKIAREQGETLEMWEGGSHTGARIGERQTTIPRHNEINELTARSILRHMQGETK